MPPLRRQCSQPPPGLKARGAAFCALHNIWGFEHEAGPANRHRGVHCASGEGAGLGRPPRLLLGHGHRTVVALKPPDAPTKVLVVLVSDFRGLDEMLVVQALAVLLRSRPQSLPGFVGVAPGRTNRPLLFLAKALRHIIEPRSSCSVHEGVLSL